MIGIRSEALRGTQSTKKAEKFFRLLTGPVGGDEGDLEGAAAAARGVDLHGERALLLQAAALDVLLLGEAAAFARGVNVRRVRTTVLVAGSLAVAASVAWVGPIAFVGLVVPHLVRLSLGPRRAWLLPASALTGAAFVAGGDAVARALVPNGEVPVGVVTAALGAPVLIGLVLRRARRPM